MAGTITVDPVDKLAIEFESGIRCMACHRIIEGPACVCQMDRLQTLHDVEVADWLGSVLPEGKDRASKSERKMILAAARQALGRGQRRAGQTMRPSDADPLVTIAEDARSGFDYEHGIEARWTRPQSKRTPRADREPL